MRPALLALTLLALVSAASVPSATLACSCTNEPDFPRAYAESDVIFLGEALEITSAEPEYPAHVWGTFQVEADWKGAPPATVRVLTPANEGICGFPFVVGRRYLVYAFETAPGVVAAGLCWRTHESWPEDPDIALLNAITPVLPASWGSLKIRYR